VVTILACVVLTVPLWLGICAWVGLGLGLSLSTLIIALVTVPLFVLCSIAVSNAILMRVSHARGATQGARLK
jgi:hypothetical protein